MANFQTTVTETLADSMLAASLGRILVGNGQMRMIKIPIAASLSAAEKDTLLDLPVNSVVHNVYVEVTVAEVTGTGKTLDVGLVTTDPDGFIDGLSVSSTGIKQGEFVATVGGNNTYLGAASSHTIGALLTGLLIAGEDVASGGDGFGSKKAFATTTVQSISWTQSNNDWVEFRGNLWITYEILSNVLV